MSTDICSAPASASVASADGILCAALDVGEHLLKNGAEIHRVEDTIERIGHALGAVHVEVMAVTSFIVASVRMPDGSSHQQLRRLPHSCNNLYMIEEMNEISRELCAGRLPLDEVRPRILAAKAHRPYTWWMTVLAALVFGIGVALFFGGGFLDCVCVAFAGTLAFLLKSRRTQVNPMVVTLFSSCLGASLALVLLWCGLGSNTYAVMSGTVMFLVPGLAFGNSFRDMLDGDTLAGMMRLFQTLLQALMLALGFAAAIWLFGRSAVSTDGSMTHAWYILLPSGTLFAVGYAVMNMLPMRRLPWVSVGAMLTTFVFWLALPLGDFISNLLAVLFATLFCEIAARLGRAPAINFLTPTIIPLVPGGLLYYTVHFYIVGEHADALAYGNQTLAACFGIAAGVLLGSFLWRLILPKHKH